MSHLTYAWPVIYLTDYCQPVLDESQSLLWSFPVIIMNDFRNLVPHEKCYNKSETTVEINVFLLTQRVPTGRGCKSSRTSHIQQTKCFFLIETYLLYTHLTQAKRSSWGLTCLFTINYILHYFTTCFMWYWTPYEQSEILFLSNSISLILEKCFETLKYGGPNYSVLIGSRTRDYFLYWGQN
jgi:hypothetical protein